MTEVKTPVQTSLVDELMEKVRVYAEIIKDGFPKTYKDYIAPDVKELEKKYESREF